jgi:ABC-type multidrug transport system fused ATPase/permease subunit
MKESGASFRKVFKSIIWPRRGLLLAGLGLIIINRLSGLVLPGASKFLIDEVVANKDLELLKWLILAVVAALLVQSVTSYALTQLLSVEAQHLIAKLRVEVQRQIVQMPVRFFDNSKSGELVSRIMTDVEGVRNLIGTGLVQLVGGVLTSVVALVLLLNISPQLTLYVLVPLIIFGLISLKAFKFIRPIFRARSIINAEVTGRLTESLNGIRVIKGFNAEQQEVNMFEQGVERLFKNVKKTLTTTSLVTSASVLLLGLAGAGIMGIGGYLIMIESMSVGDFIAFTLYLGFLIAPIVQMSNIGTQITEAFAGLDRTEELMSLPREHDDEKRVRILQNIKGDIRFQNVSFAYEPDKEVIHEVSFTAPTGSVTALVGSSGSGKTTIAGLVASFLQPQTGHIYLDGIDLSEVRLDSYRSHLGVVLQDDFLFEGSIKENILFPRPDATEQDLLDAVRLSYVDEFTKRFPEGLDTRIGERGIKLSGGQRQRVAIARAILANPRILILDEATSSLDAESEAFIQKSLSWLMQGRTTFVIAHRLSTIRKANQILVVENGQIVEKGTHEELISAGGRYYELFTYQARI